MIDLYTVSISWWDVFHSLSSPVWFIRQWLFLVNYSNAIFFYALHWLFRRGHLFSIRGIEPLAIVTIQVFSMFVIHFFSFELSDFQWLHLV